MEIECNKFLTIANYTSDNLPKAPVYGYVRKNPIDYFELHNRIILDCRVRKHLFPKLHKFGDIWNLIPQMYVFSGLWGKFVNVMNKIT